MRQVSQLSQLFPLHFFDVSDPLTEQLDQWLNPERIFKLQYIMAIKRVMVSNIFLYACRMAYNHIVSVLGKGVGTIVEFFAFEMQWEYFNTTFLSFKDLRHPAYLVTWRFLQTMKLLFRHGETGKQKEILGAPISTKCIDP